MKLKIASLSYFFIALITSLCLFFLKANVPLMVVGYYGNSYDILPLLAATLVPFLFMIFLLFFDSSKKVVSSVAALLIAGVSVSRITASISNLSYLKSQEVLTTSKFILYAALMIIAGAIAVSFVLLAFSDGLKSIGTTVLKVSSILGIIFFSLLFIAFFTATFILGGERDQQNYFVVMALIFLMDFANCLLMLLSVGGLRRTLYYRKKED